jgi:hypothetical protein
MNQFLLSVAAAVWLATTPLLVIACSVRESGSSATDGDLSEASMNFDADGVLPFLQRIGNIVEDFSATQAQALANEIAGVPIESKRTWTFTVRYQGAEVPLRVHAFMDDTDSPDLAFFTKPDLAAVIQREMTAYAEERGI